MIEKTQPFEIAREKSADQIDFGYDTIPRAEKASAVRRVFDSVASRYDLMNDLMSGGIHRLWKSLMLDALRPTARDTLLDVAGGTGDIGLGYLKRGGGDAIICDINHAMLAAGAATPARGRRGLAARASWVCGDAEALPLPDRSVNAYSIAFGIRNVTDRDQALREAARVLRPGGRFACLEFAEPDMPVLDQVYDFYSFQVIPRVGAAVTGDRDSYQYLVESIRRFPAPGLFTQQISDAGLSRARFQSLSGGIATLYTAWRL